VLATVYHDGIARAINLTCTTQFGKNHDKMSVVMNMDRLLSGSAEFHPLVPERWLDLEKLFGKHGASGGCWCMWWRQTRAEFSRKHGEPNRLAFKAIVESGVVPGLLAYSGGQPVGWCAVEPRESYPALDRSRTLARVDDAPVWSITCFYINTHFRGRGLMRGLLLAAIDWASRQGAGIVEAYPVDSQVRLSNASVYTGVVPVFREAGFVEVLRRSKGRPIMRKSVS
jgi:GNAT superfamily N-acetyltransferase